MLTPEKEPDERWPAPAPGGVAGAVGVIEPLSSADPPLEPVLMVGWV